MNNRTEAKLTDLSGMQKAIEEILKQAWERGRKYQERLCEDKQGHWISHDTDSRGYSDCFECSECGALVYPRNCEQELDYVCCPYCKVDMRKENHDED